MGFFDLLNRKKRNSMEQSSHVANLTDAMCSQDEKQSIESTQTHNSPIYKLEDLIAMRSEEHTSELQSHA